MTMRFGKEFENRRLRLHFSDGQVCDGLIIEVADPEDGDGFVFDTLDDRDLAKEKAPAIWAVFADLQKYELLEK